MTRCSRCGFERSDPAQPCPQCGFKTRLVPEWILWFDIFVLILAVVGFFVTGGSPMMAVFGVAAFLYMLFDLGRRNAQRPVVQVEEPPVEAREEGEMAEEVVEEGTDEEEEEFIPEEPEEGTCRSCGEVLEPGAKFCGHCGQKQE